MESCTTYRPKILIVDDERRMCESLQVLLSNEGYETRSAYGGHMAMECLSGDEFDLALLDIVMPDMNGQDLMDYISTHYPGMLVIAITGHATISSAVEFLRRGAYDYLSKPFEFEELIKRVRNAVDKKRLRKEYEIINGKLALSESRSEYLVNNSPNIIYTLDSDGKFTFIGGAVEALLGYKAEDIVGKHFTGVVAPEDIERVQRRFKAIRSGETAAGPIEIKLKPSGTERRSSLLTVELRSMAMYDTRKADSDRSYIGVHGVAIDISDRRHVEDALRESEERFRSLSENAPDIIYTLGLDLNFTYVNPAWEKSLGHERWEVLGRPFSAFVAGEDAERCFQLFDGVKENRETIEDASCRLRHRNESMRLFSISAAPNLDMHGNVVGIVGVFKDVTEQRKLEARLLHAQKMEAIGTLAGGIAHDFNNLLMGIQGRGSLMSLDIDENHPHYAHLKGIEDIVESGARLTRQLLGFARAGKYEVRTIDLNELMEKSAQMFLRARKEIRVHTDYQEGLWPVEADRGQLEQVLVNLYVNAWHAMPSGGDLYVNTQNMVLDERSAVPLDLAPGKYVKVSVRDTGVGMDETTQARIFEPFFTTKEMGRGTGLGLASAYGIVKNHGGVIDVYSKKGKGSAFFIYLPASEKTVIKEKESRGDLLTGTETILLVDDEEMIVDVGAEILHEMGYDVITAKSGAEALRIYAERCGDIDMIILDMVMPDMGGGEAFDRMKALNPAVKVLLSSGYSVDGQASQILARGCSGFIQKPFSMKLLSQCIRKVLEA